MIIKIPIRSIEHIYGKDKVDQASDDLVYCLREVEDFSGQISYDFDQELAHENPWFHTLNFIISKPTDYQLECILEKIKDLKLEHKLVDAA